MEKISIAINPTENSDSVLLTLSGELTLYSINTVLDKIKETLAEYPAVTLEINQVTGMDLSGIQLIYSIKKTLETENKKFSLRIDLPDELEELISKTGFEGLIKQK